MSSMLSEEILVTALISIAAVGVALDLARATPTRSTTPDTANSTTSPVALPPRSLGRAALWGAIAGLALLTKLSGLLIVAIGVAAYFVTDWRARGLTGALQRAFVYGAAASIVGGWYYVYNLATYGYLYPHGLDVHAVMFRMPPGVREIGDYLRIPLATFSDPQLLAPDLLRSVWGSTYVTIFFDGHRSFLPNQSLIVTRWGTAMGVLGLIPTVAFGVGVWRAGRRLRHRFDGPDLVLVFLVVSTFAGFVLFTWRNPWFAVLKGSFLLGLSVPFAYYASEVLADWTRDRSLRSRAVLGGLCLLAVLSIGAFTYGVAFEKHEIPGVHWEPVETPWQR